MRLSRTAWFILGAGIFVIAFISLLVGYSRLSGTEGRVEDSLSSAQALLPQLVSQREALASQLAQLEAQLTQAASSLESIKARFSHSVQSIEYDEVFFNIAQGCDLEVFSLTASEPAEQEVEDIIFFTTTFEVTVRPVQLPPQAEDSFEAYINQFLLNVLDFSNTVVTSEYFIAATVDLVTMDIPELADGEKPEVKITLTIYSYQGE